MVRLSFLALVLSALALACQAAPLSATPPCCQGACTTPGEEKYWSIASGIFGTKHCGECCMKPSDYKLYHFFEKNLTKSASASPCSGFGYTKYDSTVTHGFGPVKMTLDLYDLPSAAAAAPTCLHDTDATDHKCFEACAAMAFKTKGYNAAGACPPQYNSKDTSKTVTQCADGVTNLRWCPAAQVVNVTFTTKGEAGQGMVAGVLDDVTLYKIAGATCGQATLDSKYAAPAEKFAGLKEGTCASQGYTVAAGTKTVKAPVIGDITVSEFKKP